MEFFREDGSGVLGFATVPAVISLLAGRGMIALSRVRGEIEGEYGGGWRAVWKGDT